MASLFHATLDYTSVVDGLLLDLSLVTKYWEGPENDGIGHTLQDSDTVTQFPYIRPSDGTVILLNWELDNKYSDIHHSGPNYPQHAGESGSAYITGQQTDHEIWYYELYWAWIAGGVMTRPGNAPGDPFNTACSRAIVTISQPGPLGYTYDEDTGAPIPIHSVDLVEIWGDLPLSEILRNTGWFPGWMIDAKATPSGVAWTPTSNLRGNLDRQFTRFKG